MNVRELTREQLQELKGNYMVELANEDRFAEVVGRDYDAPSWDDFANVDEIISDEVIYERYGFYTFGMDDFWCTAGQLVEEAT